MSQRFTTGDEVRVVVDGTMTHITRDGTFTVQYPSDLGACETSVELEGTAVRVLPKHVLEEDVTDLRDEVVQLRSRVSTLKGRLHQERTKANRALADLDDMTAERDRVAADIETAVFAMFTKADEQGVKLDACTVDELTRMVMHAIRSGAES